MFNISFSKNKKINYLLVIFIVMIINFYFIKFAIAKPYRIYAFGDSITYGFANTGEESLTNSNSYRFKLANMLKNYGIDVRIINGGVPGETVLDGKKRFNEIFPEKPNLVIIMFGTNDCSAKSKEDLTPKVDIKTYKETLSYFINELKNKNIDVILMTPPPLPTERLTVLNNKRLNPYVLAVREIALTYKIDLVDNFINFQNSSNLFSLFLFDQIHPNSNGHEIIAKGIFEILTSNTSRVNFLEKMAEMGAITNIVQKTDIKNVKSNYNNLALGCTYIENSKSDKCLDGVLTDGIISISDPNKIYFTSNSNKFPKWILIDLEKKQNINLIKIYNTNTLDCKTVSTYYANEPGKYMLIGAGEFKQPLSCLEFQVKKNIKARYIKIEIEDSYNDQNKISLLEVEVF